MRMNWPSDLEEFIKEDKERYLAFVCRFNEAVDRLPIGGVLKVEEFVLPDQYKLFVKLADWHSFLSRWHSDKPYYYEMLPDCSGIKKRNR